MARSRGILRLLSRSEQNSRTGPSHTRGPKPKRIHERQLRPDDIRPIHRLEYSWSQKQKIRVLVFLYHHRIPTTNPQTGLTEYRAPTQLEASSIFRVPQSTISYWVRNQETIESYGYSNPVHSPHTVSICRWPELESELYRLFLNQRGIGQGCW